jgi:type IV pilus assembly protein PilQ
MKKTVTRWLGSFAMVIAISVGGLNTPSWAVPSNAIPRISMDVNSVSLKDVLKMFSQQSGLNFIAGEDVQEKEVTLFIQDVSIEDALTTIIIAADLAYYQLEKSDIFIVTGKQSETIETITRIFRLQYARVTGFGFSVGDDDGNSSGSTGSSTSGSSSSASFPDVELEQSDDSIDRGFDKVIQELLSDHGTLVADQRTNSLIVTDTPQRVEIIAEAIARLDTKTPQVMISAEILDTTSQVVDDIGFEWGSGAEGQFFGFVAPDKSTYFPFTLGKGGDLISSLDSRSKTLGTFALGSTSTTALDVTLDLLTQHTDTEILARPRILTLANETAIIKLTTDTAIASVTTIASAGSNISTEAQNQAERVETGISLRVTPMVNDLGYITMQVEPSVVNAKTSSFFTSTTFVDPSTRGSKTTVRVRDGQTIVIGGLISKDNTEVIRKVPMLGDLPLIGPLFTRADRNDTDRELIIFVTPNIVHDAEELIEMTGAEEITRERVVEVPLDRWVAVDALNAHPVEVAGMNHQVGILKDYKVSRKSAINQAVKKLSNGVAH